MNVLQQGDLMSARALWIAITVFVSGCDGAEQRTSSEVALKATSQFIPTSAGASPIAEGERVARILGCLGCHGKDLQGAVWDEEPEFGVVAPSNLTRSATRYSDKQLERMIREGIRPDGSPLWEMPSEAFTHLSRGDMTALLAYLRSFAPAGPERPRPTFGLGAKKEIEQGKLLSTPQKVALERDQEPWLGGPPHERGRYVARLACGECHGPQLSGSDEPFRPDLTVASGYSLDEFKRLVRTGEPTGGRKLGLMAQVSKSRFSHLNNEEVEALYRYLVARTQQSP